MKISEQFNQERMNRCSSLAGEIMQEWSRSTVFKYVVRATESLDGLGLSELSGKYFSVGVHEPKVDLPFLDLLVTFSIIRQQHLALQSRKMKPNEKTFKISSTIKTEFTHDEAAQLLSEIQIETPFDEGKLLRVVAKRQDSSQ